jgi:hypothetical protein
VSCLISRHVYRSGAVEGETTLFSSAIPSADNNHFSLQFLYGSHIYEGARESLTVGSHHRSFFQSQMKLTFCAADSERDGGRDLDFSSKLNAPEKVCAATAAAAASVIFQFHKRSLARSQH